MSLEDLKKIPYGKTAIELKNISLAFGGVKALTDVSFDVKKGEVSQIVSDGKKLYFAYIKSVQSNKAKAKKIKENSEEHFASVIKDGIFHELIAHLASKNKMQVLQNNLN